MKKDNFSEEEFYEGGQIYETIFRWEDEWLSALIKPYSPEENQEQYIVKVINGPLTFIKKNAEGRWEENDIGTTQRAEVLGRAVQYAMIEQQKP
jgi:hypothetical protein